MDDISKAVREIQDRQAIMDCLTAYCTGVDRLDRELIMKAYHPDAEENHTGVIVGKVTKLLDWIFGPFKENLLVCNHQIHNHRCELDGDVAHTETYCSYSEVRSVPPYSNQMAGRYIDRFERRDGRWAIATRVLVMDWIIKTPGEPALTSDKALSSGINATRPTFDRSDFYYRRPLVL